MEGRELRRSVTLSEQLSAVDSSSLGDLLKIREEDELRLSRRRGGDSVTLGSVIECDKREGSAAGGGGGGRTLLDIILQDHEANGIVADGNSSSGAVWKSLRDRLHLHPAGTVWAAASPGHSHPISDTELVDSAHPNPVSVSHSVSAQNSELAVPEPAAMAAATATTAAELPSVREGGSEEINGSEDSDPGGAVESSAQQPEEEEPARVSLMALLEQTDRQWGGSGTEGLSLEAAVAEEAAEDEVEGGDRVMMYMCCVCMVRHKGAAFIPCGHTFCRLCSRELWVSRGTCPLCNGHILDILDIF